MLRRVLFASLALLLIGAGLGVGLAGAQGNDVPERALPLINPTTGSLTGDRAGAFAYYRFDYPGKHWVAKLTLSFSPDDSVVHPAIGLNIYAPDGTAYNTRTIDTFGLQQVRFASGLAGSYLVQVYNYAPGHTIHYTLTLQGVPVPAAPTPTPAPNALIQSLSGSLVGNRGGAFAYYTFYYPGDGSTVRLSATFWPADEWLNRGQGFNVYWDGRLIARSHPKRDDIARQTAEFSSALAGTFVIQVYNYNPGVTTHYTLSRE